MANRGLEAALMEPGTPWVPLLVGRAQPRSLGFPILLPGGSNRSAFSWGFTCEMSYLECNSNDAKDNDSWRVGTAIAAAVIPCSVGPVWCVYWLI